MDKAGIPVTDDIVTRLRQEWEYGNNAKGCDYEMFAEAADEIEHLRAENNKASALIAKLAELLMPYSMLMNKHEQELLVKAVRGE